MASVPNMRKLESSGIIELSEDEGSFPKPQQHHHIRPTPTHNAHVQNSAAMRRATVTFNNNKSSSTNGILRGILKKTPPAAAAASEKKEGELIITIPDHRGDGDMHAKEVEDRHADNNTQSSLQPNQSRTDLWIGNITPQVSSRLLGMLLSRYGAISR